MRLVPVRRNVESLAIGDGSDVDPCEIRLVAEEGLVGARVDDHTTPRTFSLLTIVD